MKKKKWWTKANTTPVTIQETNCKQSAECYEFRSKLKPMENAKSTSAILEKILCSTTAGAEKNIYSSSTSVFFVTDDECAQRDTGRSSSLFAYSTDRPDSRCPNFASPDTFRSRWGHFATSRDLFAAFSQI